MVALLRAAGPLPMPEIASRLELEQRDVGSAFGALAREGVLAMDGGKQVNVAGGESERVATVRGLLERLAGGGSLAVEALSDTERAQAAALSRKRGAARGVFRATETETVSYVLTTAGHEARAAGRGRRAQRCGGGGADPRHAGRRLLARGAVPPLQRQLAAGAGAVRAAQPLHCLSGPGARSAHRPRLRGVRRAAGRDQLLVPGCPVHAAVPRRPRGARRLLHQAAAPRQPPARTLPGARRRHPRRRLADRQPRLGLPLRPRLRAPHHPAQPTAPWCRPRR